MISDLMTIYEGEENRNRLKLLPVDERVDPKKTRRSYATRGGNALST
jgi:hypothetical protein